jgi:hypothetical protein
MSPNPYLWLNEINLLLYKLLLSPGGEIIIACPAFHKGYFQSYYSSLLIKYFGKSLVFQTDAMKMER